MAVAGVGAVLTTAYFVVASAGSARASATRMRSSTSSRTSGWRGRRCSRRCSCSASSRWPCCGRRRTASWRVADDPTDRVGGHHSAARPGHRCAGGSARRGVRPADPLGRRASSAWSASGVALASTVSMRGEPQSAFCFAGGLEQPTSCSWIVDDVTIGWWLIMLVATALVVLLCWPAALSGELPSGELHFLLLAVGHGSPGRRRVGRPGHAARRDGDGVPSGLRAGGDSAR